MRWRETFKEGNTLVRGRGVAPPLLSPNLGGGRATTCDGGQTGWLTFKEEVQIVSEKQGRLTGPVEKWGSKQKMSAGELVIGPSK